MPLNKMTAHSTAGAWPKHAPSPRRKECSVTRVTAVALDMGHQSLIAYEENCRLDGFLSERLQGAHPVFPAV